MKKYLLPTFLGLSILATSSVTLAVKPLAVSTTANSIVTGVVEHIESVENESMVKVKGVAQLLIIKDLMAFPENKLQALQDSQENNTIVKIKINEKNQIIDVIL